MNSFKRSLFITLLVFFLIFMGYLLLVKKIKNDNPTFMNSAEEITLKQGEYIIGQDLKPGFYDIDSLSDNVSFMPVKLSKGDKIVGQKCEKGTHVYIKGKGTVKLSPAKYKSLAVDNRNEYTILHSGNYIIGKQIPAGKYKITYSNKNKEIIEKPFIQVLPGYGENPLKSIDFRKKDNDVINVQIGDIFEVHKSLTEEYDDVFIKLKSL